MHKENVALANRCPCKCFKNKEGAAPRRKYGEPGPFATPDTT
jgi:hypothetical protein